MLNEQKKIVIIGSYRQNLSGILDLVNELSRQGHTILYPRTNSRAAGERDGFVRLDQDEHEDEGEQQRVVFRCIDEADLVIAFNPDHRLGSSSALEIGYSLSKSKPVATTSIPSDITLRKLTRTLDSRPQLLNISGEKLFDIFANYSNRSTLQKWSQGVVRPVEGTLDIIDSVETHTCRVFFSATHAFKIRKSIDLGFLDYSTLEKRLIYAMEELEMGRRMSPYIYIGIWYYSPHTGKLDSVMAVRSEPVVVMRRLPSETRGDIVFNHNHQAKADRIDGVARWLANYHNSSPVDLDPTGWGRPEAAYHLWKINFDQMPEPSQNALIPLTQDEWTKIQIETDEWFDLLRPILLQRIKEGRIRRTHGDLRIEHIYLTELTTSVIDPLEFDISLAFTDVAAEVGFLSMTLENMGRQDVAERLEGLYAEKTGDNSLFKVLPFFKRYRAVVRMKIEWLRATQLQLEERPHSLKKARALAELALAYRLK